MLKKSEILGFCFVALVLIAVSSHAAAPSKGNVDPPAAGASYSNLSAAATLGSIARIGQNDFKCVTNCSTFPAFQGEPAFLTPGSADGYSVCEYRSTAQYALLEGIWYCNKTGSVTIEAGKSGWVQTTGIANAFISGEGTNIVEWDNLAPFIYSGCATSDTYARLFLIRGSATAVSAATAEGWYPKSFQALTNAGTNTATLELVYFGNKKSL
jgi:hypothetical protein